MTASHPQRRHTAFQTLPIVDISGLLSTDFDERLATAKHLGTAAEDVGFLYIRGHGIAAELIDNLKQRTREYFAQPMAEKMRHYIGNSVNHSGYVPEGEEQFYSNAVDRKEAYDINYDMSEPQFRRPMLGPTQWPDMPGFKVDVHAYYQAALALGRDLFRGFALALGLPEHSFTQRITRPPSQLRLVHYPYDPAVPADRPGIGAHTDYECFTILLPTAPGLEVLNGAGEWIDVPLLEDTFVINVGDMMEILSNGRFTATNHRVRKVAQERYSFPMFCNLDYDTLIEPLPTLLNDDNPPRYEPLICGDHLYAQTMQTFSYLKKRMALGEVQLPERTRGLSTFGRKTEGCL